MTLTVGIPKETTTDDTRVAAVPDTVASMVKAGMTVYVEKEAGLRSYFKDADYVAAGATMTSATDLYKAANIILKVTRPTDADIDLMRDNSTLIAPLYATRAPSVIEKLSAKKITAFALELVPRIARAQSMDILSSMSNLAGYKSVILAANYLGKIFPMMTTAAGTIPPAKIIVIGAGVAGLQAIATARRLGGVVIVFDTRPIVEEQVKSLGADFVSLETKHEQVQDAGGYAKEQTAEFYQQEQDIIHQYIKDADVVITTALIPNKRAPILITEAMVKEMKPGSVIVDLAAEQQGNCLLTEPGKIVVRHDVTLIGVLNLQTTLPINASRLFAKNIFTFLNTIAPSLESGQFDLTDDIIKNCLLLQNGNKVHPALKPA